MVFKRWVVGDPEEEKGVAKHGKCYERLSTVAKEGGVSKVLSC